MSDGNKHCAVLILKQIVIRLTQKQTKQIDL